MESRVANSEQLTEYSLELTGRGVARSMYNAVGKRLRCAVFGAEGGKVYCHVIHDTLFVLRINSRNTLYMLHATV